MTSPERLIEEIMAASRFPSERRRREVLRELRAHMEDFVSAGRKSGRGEEEIERLLLDRFGDPRQIAQQFAWVYRRERGALHLSGFLISTLVVSLVILAGTISMQAGIRIGFGTPFVFTSRHTIVMALDILASVAAYLGLVSLGRFFERPLVVFAMVAAALLAVFVAAGLPTQYLLFGFTNGALLRGIQLTVRHPALRLGGALACFGVLGAVFLHPSSSALVATAASWLIMGLAYHLMTHVAARVDQALLRRLSACAAIAAMLLVSGLARAQSNSQPPPRLYRAYGKKAPEVYKNIQVLTEIDSTELIPTMQYMADSLGVGCDFCHVQTGSDKDEKAMKLKARQMILMTREINQNHFAGNKAVSCVVCHRGAELPGFSAAIPEDGSSRAAASAQKPPANLPTADQIFERYLQAVGGAAAVQKISTRIEKGTFSSGDSKLPYEIYTRTPDRRAAITHDPNGDTINGFNGTSGWIEVLASSPPGRDLIPSEIAAAKLDADLRFALDARQILQGLRALPPEKIDGKEMYVLSGKPENMRPVRLYFDEQTGLLARILRYTEVPLGFTPVRVDYADYRDVDGVKIPFRRTQARPSGRSIVEIDTVQQNVPIDESKFNRPRAAQEH